MNEKRPNALPHLIGLPAPTVSLPWTIYADRPDLLRQDATTSLATIAAYETLVVYFFPAESEDDPPDADTMSRAFRDGFNDIGQLRAQVVGVSTQTELEQRQITALNRFRHLLLADSEMELADALQLPTVEIDGRDEYPPMTTIIRDGHIVHAFYPIASPRAHIAEILAWLENPTNGA